MVRDFYNHDVHIKVHDKFRKSDEYNQLPPELQQFIDAHVAQHKQFIQQQLMAMMPPQPAASILENVNITNLEEWDKIIDFLCNAMFHLEKAIKQPLN
jgi:hypothetical protein